MKNFLLFLSLMFTGISAFGQPASPAPTPTCASGDVISMFSEAYTDIAVGTWRTVWSVADYTPITVGGNAVHQYTNLAFVGIETAGSVDASSMSNFHIDVYTSNMTQIKIKLVDFGGDGFGGANADTEGEITVFDPPQNQWITLTLPLSSFMAKGLGGTNDIAQLILSGEPSGGGTLFVDNVYYSNSTCHNPVPATAAVAPECPPATVTSLFSNAYGNVPVDTWRTSWSNADFSDVLVAGNATKLYQNLSFVGIETVGPNLLDLTQRNFLQLDYWTPDLMVFKIKLVDFGADGNFGGGDDSEHEITINNPPKMGWNHLTIPLADFTGLSSRSHIAQIILSGVPAGAGTLYLDNLMFTQTNCIPDPIPTMGEWALMIFGLLTLNVGLMFVNYKETLLDL